MLRPGDLLLGSDSRDSAEQQPRTRLIAAASHVARSPQCLRRALGSAVRDEPTRRLAHKAVQIEGAPVAVAGEHCGDDFADDARPVLDGSSLH